MEDPAAFVLREQTSGPRYRSFLRSRNGTERTIEGNTSPIRPEAGSLAGVVLVFRDVTEHKQAEEALRFLAQASTALASSLDYQTTLDRVTRLAVPWLADWALVYMAEPDGSTRLLALTHQDPAKVVFGRELLRRFPWPPDAPAGVNHVMSHRAAGPVPGNPGCDPGGNGPGCRAPGSAAWSGPQVRHLRAAD